MDKAIYKRYAEIKGQMKKLEEEESFIKQVLLQDLEANDADKIAFDFGKFTRSTRVSYKYSDKVLTLQEKVKLAQLKEQEKGIAKEVKSHYLTFTPPKMN
jgi:hypothetical protein